MPPVCVASDGVDGFFRWWTTEDGLAADAGHEYPAFKQGDGPFKLYKDKHGLVLGAMEGVEYKGK
ncbi:MAG: serine/threonine-protein phosphatase [Clostridia bacterium]|nr:serine/threonine-protein phosphatase [Clostridia bacterium]